MFKMLHHGHKLVLGNSAIQVTWFHSVPHAPDPRWLPESSRFYITMITTNMTNGPNAWWTTEERTDTRPVTGHMSMMRRPSKHATSTCSNSGIQVYIWWFTIFFRGVGRVVHDVDIFFQRLNKQLLSIQSPETTICTKNCITHITGIMHTTHLQYVEGLSGISDDIPKLAFNKPHCVQINLQCRQARRKGLKTKPSDHLQIAIKFYMHSTRIYWWIYGVALAFEIMFTMFTAI